MVYHDMLLKRTEVEKMLSLGRQSLYHLMKNNGFPQPVRLSSKRIAWVKDEVCEWIAAQPRGTHDKAEFFPFKRRAADPVQLAVAVSVPAKTRKRPAKRGKGK